MGIGIGVGRRPGGRGGEGGDLLARCSSPRSTARRASCSRSPAPPTWRCTRSTRRPTPSRRSRTPTPTSSSARSSTTRSATRSASPSSRPASTSWRPPRRATNQFESRLSRLLEEPVPHGGVRARDAALDPRRRRRRRRVHDRERPEPTTVVVRRRGGPGHPGLPEELAVPRPPRAAPHESGAGRSRSEEAPFPRLLAEEPPRPRSMSPFGTLAPM